MQAKTVARFGSWESPVTPDLITGATIGFSELAVDGDAVYWLESRAAEQGRRALVRWTPGAPAGDALPRTTDVATRVHEYGGGAYAVRDGLIVYSERNDGSVWLAEGNAPPRALITVAGCRYAGFAIDAETPALYAVREDHRDRLPTAPENTIVMCSLAAGGDPAADAGAIVASGTDFVLAPQLSRDGTQLAWIAWDHPDMPWDATRLCAGSVDADGRVSGARCLAGAGGNESIAAAGWAPDGALLFVSDRTNWWNLYALRGERVDALAPAAMDFAEPPWVFGRRAFAPVDAARVLCAFIRDGIVRPGLIEGGAVRELGYGPVDTTPLPFGDGAVFLAAPPDAPGAVCRVAHLDDSPSEIVRSAASQPLDAADISVGEPLTVTSAGGEDAQLFFYPPRNAPVHRSGGRAPAADRNEPRRPDGDAHQCTEHGDPVVDFARLCGRARELSRFVGLRPALSLVARRRLGHRRRRRLHRGRA